MNIKLKTEILKSGLKQSFVAAKIGITQVRFSRIIHEEIKPNIKEKKAIAKILNKSINRLFET